VISGTLLLAAAGGRAAADPAPAPAANKYIGAAKCKMCHSSEKSGDQFAHWSAADHAKAWEALASDQAKKIATEKGIADPQKADECVKCHMTGFGLPDDELARGFKKDQGVQCESCHGPGDAHMKARLAAAATAKEGELQVIPEGEIVSAAPAATCLGCHNAESPTFTGFCYPTMAGKIAHLNPLKGRTQAQIDEMFKCPCGETCPGLKGEACDKCNAGK
jgi:hypothetical protein